MEISGKCLMNGKTAVATIKKTDKKGIWFVNNGEYLQPTLDKVVSTNNFVVVGDNRIQVCLIEHFMAAMSFCNIKDVEIHISDVEMPILDGSAKVWVDNLKNSEFCSDTPVEITEFNNPVCYENGNTAIALLPSDRFQITYLVNFNHKDLKNTWVSFDSSQDATEIIEARTFGYLKDLEKFHQMGIAKGADLENTVGLKDDGTYTVPLRSDLESAKHKILDIIGDLSLTGRNPLGFKAHIIAKLAGHSSHVEFAKKILKEIK